MDPMAAHRCPHCGAENDGHSRGAAPGMISHTTLPEIETRLASLIDALMQVRTAAHRLRWTSPDEAGRASSAAAKIDGFDRKFKSTVCP